MENIHLNSIKCKGIYQHWILTSNYTEREEQHERYSQKALIVNRKQINSAYKQTEEPLRQSETTH